MKCPTCEALLPSHYKICPVCASPKLIREAFVQQQPEIVEVEKISAEVITSGFEIGEIDD